jgi:hypothetical protein
MSEFVGVIFCVVTLLKGRCIVLVASGVCGVQCSFAFVSPYPFLVVLGLSLVSILWCSCFSSCFIFLYAISLVLLVLFCVLRLFGGLSWVAAAHRGSLLR